MANTNIPAGVRDGDASPLKLSDLRQAVEDWVIAEKRFRFGSNAYSRMTGEALDKAEHLLRRAVSGRSNLSEAFRVIIRRRKKSCRE